MASSNIIKIDKKITSWALGAPSIKPTQAVVLSDVKLPIDAPARMKTLKAENKKWYLTVVSWPDNPEKPFALFCQTNCREPSVQTLEAVEQLITLAKAHPELVGHLSTLTAKMMGDNNVNKLTRLISFLLRHNVEIHKIVTELDKLDNVFVGSFLFQIKKHLATYIPDGTSANGTCEECGSTNVQFAGGCLTCMDCGSSKCG